MYSQQFNPKLAVVVSFPGLATGSQPHSTSLVWVRTNHMKEITGIKKKTNKKQTPKRHHPSEGVFRWVPVSRLPQGLTKCGAVRGHGEIGKGKGESSSSSCGSWNSSPGLLFHPRATITLNSLAALHSLGMGAWQEHYAHSLEHFQTSIKDPLLAIAFGSYPKKEEKKQTLIPAFPIFIYNSSILK